MPPRPRWRSAWRSSGSCIVIVSFVWGATLEEIAVEGELANQGIDLAQRERRRRMALEVAAGKLVRWAEVERDGARGVDRRRAVLAGERQQPLDAAHGAQRIVRMERGRELPHVRTDRRGPGEELQGRGQRAPRPVVGVLAILPEVLPFVLTQERARVGIEDAHDARVPLDGDVVAEAAGWDPVVRLGDFHAAVGVHGAGAEGVVPKRGRRQRPEVRALLRKHRRDLALGGPMDARVSPARLPVIEVDLRVSEPLEAQPLEGRALRVADPRLDLSLAIGIPDAARQRGDAVVGEHVAIEGIERRLVDVGAQHALAEVVEDDDGRRPAEPRECPFVELRPDAGARLPREQADALAAVAEREQEEPRAPILARRGVADHGAVAVVDLALLARRRLNHGVGLGGRGAAELADEAHDARVGGGEAVGVDEVLPDRHRVAPAGERRRDQLPVRLARAGGGTAPGRGRGGAAGESVDTPTPLAGFDAGPAPESVDTSMAGFGGWPHRPGGRTTTPAARR